MYGGFASVRDEFGFEAGFCAEQNRAACVGPVCGLSVGAERGSEGASP